LSGRIWRAHELVIGTGQLGTFVVCKTIGILILGMLKIVGNHSHTGGAGNGFLVDKIAETFFGF
jgi:hypothetical protein